MKPSALNGGHPTLQNMNFSKKFYFCGSFLPSWIRIRIPNTDPDPDPLTRLNPDPQPWIKYNTAINERRLTSVEAWFGEPPEVGGDLLLALVIIEHGEGRVLQRARELQEPTDTCILYRFY